MRFHWQNLNEDGVSKRKGSPLKNGRAWWHFFVTRAGEREWTLAWEWSFKWKGRSVGAYVDAGGDEDLVGFHVGALGIAFWVHLQVPYRHWLRRFVPRDERQLGFRDHDGSIYFNLWVDPWGGWDSRKKWYQQRTPSLHYVDLLLGEQKYSEHELSTTPVIVPMPEASYRGTCKMVESTWRRSRWPFPKRLVRANLDIPGGVPHPGKGENSWDCGEDATFGLTTAARSPEQAIASLVETVLTKRAKYGGRDWRPTRTRPQNDRAKGRR